MKLYIATDHAGFDMKESLVVYLAGKGYEVEDCGAYTLDAYDDYPDFVHKAAKAVSANPNEARAIVLGGSGQGEAMVVNRYKGVRAAIYYGGSLDIVTLSRQHNDANVLSLGSRFITIDEAKQAVEAWLGAAFSHDERHVRRIAAIENIHE
jgi:ribose 5-phosphate isomerase B